MKNWNSLNINKKLVTVLTGLEGAPQQANSGHPWAVGPFVSLLFEFTLQIRYKKKRLFKSTNLEKM